MTADTHSDSAEQHRPIVSFAPRGGRMNDVQRRAWEAYADRWLVERDQLPDRPSPESTAPARAMAQRQAVDSGEGGASGEGGGRDEGFTELLGRLFGRDAPMVIEIGPGMGDATAAMAAARPEVNIVAIEVYKPGIAQTFAHLARHGVDNVRVLRADAAEVLRNVVIPGSLAELWLFFPDPWPKRKHHKRRIVTAEFARLVASRLRPGGSWYLATDWEPYAMQIRQVVDDSTVLERADADADGWAARPAFRPETRFERRGLAADRRIYDLRLVRRD